MECVSDSMVLLHCTELACRLQPIQAKVTDLERFTQAETHKLRLLHEMHGRFFSWES